ncbi:MAG: hypothetical protein ACRC67_15655 [Inquilinus sp.]|uniref:hypothetical protein n=1 Tax=Inquilinus sp. TaxID=1932117 RepID=UPI003F310664
MADASSPARIAFQGKPLDAYTKKDLIALVALLLADYDLLAAELSDCRQALNRALHTSSRGFVRGRLPSL